MAATSKTAPSTPRLSEYAQHFVFPKTITRTVWTRVEAKGRDLGLGFDWWQSQLGTVCLGYDSGGKYVATVGGIGLSIPRQVGKTYFVLAMLVILCILFPGLQVVWTSHHLRTTNKTFTTLRGMCRRKKIAPHIRPGGIRIANGEGQVSFANGSVIMFGARSQGFGRGFDEIDVEVFDEAQILDTKALEDMIAATNQSRHEHGALLFFMGTPPRPADKAEAFTNRRDKAVAGKAPNAIWLEIAADADSGPDDRSQWPKMNPSFPRRTPLESMLRLRENLSDDDSWNREGRGIWDPKDGNGALPFGTWVDLADPTAARGTAVSFGVDVAEDRTAWIAVAWEREDGNVHAMLANKGEPLQVGALVPECARLVAEWGGSVVPPRAFEASLELAGVPFEPMTSGDFTAACGVVLDRITERTIRHGNQKALNAAVKAAKWRATSTTGERAFQLKDCPEIGPLAAMTRALHGLSSGPTGPTYFRLPR